MAEMKERWSLAVSISRVMRSLPTMLISRSQNAVILTAAFSLSVRREKISRGIGAGLGGFCFGSSLHPKMVVQKIDGGEDCPDWSQPLEVVDIFGGNRAVARLPNNVRGEGAEAAADHSEAGDGQLQVINLSDGYVLRECGSSS